MQRPSASTTASNGWRYHQDASLCVCERERGGEAGERERERKSFAVKRKGRRQACDKKAISGIGTGLCSILPSILSTHIIQPSIDQIDVAELMEHVVDSPGVLYLSERQQGHVSGDGPTGGESRCR